jgi:hypothetical protein
MRVPVQLPTVSQENHEDRTSSRIKFAAVQRLREHLIRPVGHLLSRVESRLLRQIFSGRTSAKQRTRK